MPIQLWKQSIINNLGFLKMCVLKTLSTQPASSLVLIVGGKAKELPHPSRAFRDLPRTPKLLRFFIALHVVINEAHIPSSINCSFISRGCQIKFKKLEKKKKTMRKILGYIYMHLKCAEFQECTWNMLICTLTYAGCVHLKCPCFSSSHLWRALRRAWV